MRTHLNPQQHALAFVTMRGCVCQRGVIHTWVTEKTVRSKSHPNTEKKAPNTEKEYLSCNQAVSTVPKPSTVPEVVMMRTPSAFALHCASNSGLLESMEQEVAIELRLKAMQFSATSFKPATARMLLKQTNEKEFDRQMRVQQLLGYSPVEYGYLGYSIRQLCGILLLIPGHIT
jgi:hypothetical protein